MVAEWQQLLPAADESSEERAGRSYGWTPQRIRRLGVTTDVETAAHILGYGRSKAYQLAKDGGFPVPLIRVGRRIIVSTAEILKLLGVDGEAA
jgi:predicted DNA-binding transcriptional regulator AlpA